MKEVVVAPSWSGRGRLLIRVDNGNSWTESSTNKPDWAELMSQHAEIAKLPAAYLSAGEKPISA